MDKVQRDEIRGRLDRPHTRDALAPLVTASELRALLDALDATERQRDDLAEGYRALLAGQPVPEYTGPVLSERGRATLDRIRPRRDVAGRAVAAPQGAAAGDSSPGTGERPSEPAGGPCVASYARDGGGS